MKLFCSFLLAATAAAFTIPSAATDRDWTITTRGYGPAHAGMTVADVSALMDARLVTSNGAPAEPFCDHLRPARGHEGLSMMVRGGRITRFGFTGAAKAQTRSGVKLGDTAARVKQVYGNRLEIKGNGDGGYHYTVWEQDGRYGIKFEIIGGRVESIYSGDRSIRYSEGCS